MIRPAIALAVFCTTAAAEDLTQDFLETPDTVWVSTDFPAFANEGQMNFLIPYLQFADGQFESGMLAGYPSIYDNSCDNSYGCPIRTTRGEVLTGPYIVRATSIEATEGTTISDWQFGEESRHDWAVAADGMYGGYVEIVRRGDRMFQETAAGSREYLPLPEDLIQAPFHLAEYADQPVELAYQCSLEQIAALAAVPPEDRTETQNQLQSLLNVLNVKMTADHRATVLDDIRVNDTLDAEQRQELDQLETVTSITATLGMLTESLLVRPEGFSFDPPELKDGPVGQEAIDRAGGMMSFMTIAGAPDPVAAQALFDELMPDMIAAAPLAARISHAVMLDTEESAISAVTCSQAE